MISVLDFKFSEMDQYGVFYGYCHKLQSYVPFEKVNEVNKLISKKNYSYDRYIIKGYDKDMNKLNIQVTGDLLKKLIGRKWIPDNLINNFEFQDF